MDVNAVTYGMSAYASKPDKYGRTEKTENAEKVEKVEKSEKINDTAATYEKSKEYNNTVRKMMEDAEEKTAQLKSLVERMLLKQGKVYNSFEDMLQKLAKGEIEVDPEVAEQAKKNIAEDGYWGVEQTSERLVSFAKALTGDDPTKADLMIEAVKKGYEQAGKAYDTDSLPDICRKTLEATIEKLTSWRDSASEEAAVN